jgi:type IV pilus assembly protein PilB
MEIKKNKYKYMLELLTMNDYITEQEKDHILQSSKFKEKTLKTLEHNYGISEEEISLIISEQYGYPIIKLNETNYLNDEELLTILPKKNQNFDDILPFEINDESIKIAIADPSKFTLIKLLSKTIPKNFKNRKLKIFITTYSEVEEATKNLAEKYYDNSGWPNEETLKAKKKLLEEEEAEILAAMENDELKIQAKKEEEEQDDSCFENTNDESAIVLVNKIIARAIRLEASDIHIEMFKTGARVRYRIEGTLIEQEDLRQSITNMYQSIVARIKILSNLDIAERRKPQDGALEFKWKSREVDLRVSLLPTFFSERVVMRILDKGAIQLDLDTLNIPERELKLIKRSIEMPKGMALVTGPTGSGKTTTLYSCLARLNKPEINILTAEDPIEYSFEGIGQTKINTKIGLTFANVLKSFLRQDPEIIMVGEIRDQETIEIAIKAALTGHFVLSTLHTNDAPSTVTRLINMGVEPYVLNSALVMILAQRLIKKTCENCKNKDILNEEKKEDLKIIGFNDEEIKNIELHKGEGCELCNNTGYKGRQGIYEVFTLNSRIKETILNAKSVEEIRDVAIEEGFITMQEHGRRMLKNGMLSIDEYKRVLLVED